MNINPETRLFDRVVCPDCGERGAMVRDDEDVAPGWACWCRVCVERAKGEDTPYYAMDEVLELAGYGRPNLPGYYKSTAWSPKNVSRSRRVRGAIVCDGDRCEVPPLMCEFVDADRVRLGALVDDLVELEAWLIADERRHPAG